MKKTKIIKRKVIRQKEQRSILHISRGEEKLKEYLDFKEETVFEPGSNLDCDPNDSQARISAYAM